MTAVPPVDADADCLPQSVSYSENKVSVGRNGRQASYGGTEYAEDDTQPQTVLRQPCMVQSMVDGVFWTSHVVCVS